MEIKPIRKTIGPWEAEAWQLREWLCQKAYEKYGKLATRDYLIAMAKLADKISQVLKR